MQRKNDDRTSKQPYDGEMKGLREIEDRQSIASWSWWHPQKWELRGLKKKKNVWTVQARMVARIERYG